MKKYFFLVALVILALSTACGSLKASLPLTFKPDTMPDAQINTPYDVNIQVSGNSSPVGDYSIAKGALPPGLELVVDNQKHTAKITGTPAQTGIFRFNLRAICNDSGQSGDMYYTMTVNDQP